MSIKKVTNSATKTTTRTTRKRAPPSTSASPLPAVIATVGAADPLPSVSAPSPPTGFTPILSGAAFTGYLPLPTQVANVTKAAAEVSDSTDYAPKLGTSVPTQSAMSAAFTAASGWSSELAAAKLWFAYVRSQTYVAWKHAQLEIDALKPAFVALASRDPAFAAEFPATALVVNARSVAGQRASATRKRAAAAKKAASNTAVVMAAPSNSVAPATTASPVVSTGTAKSGG